MINPDEIDPPRKQPKQRDLQPMSVQELEEYIASLEEEIARAENMIARKKAHRGGAEALFGKKED